MGIKVGVNIKLNNYFWNTKRDISENTEMLSHKLLLKAGYFSVRCRNFRASLYGMESNKKY